MSSLFQWVTPEWNGLTATHWCSSSRSPQSTPTATRQSEDGWARGREPHYTLAIYSIVSDIGVVLSLPCLMSDTDKTQKQCFLFYIYGWFFGLGLGVIAAISSFVENDTIATRATMSGAVVLSFAVAIVQLSLNTCAKERFDKTYRLKVISIIRICGLVLIMVATLAGAYSSDDAGGLFFICAIFAFACYLMACIGFSVRLCREYRKNQQVVENSRYEDQTVDSSQHMDYVFPRWESNNISVIYQCDDDLVQIGSRDHINAHPQALSPSHEPLPVLKLPTYLEAVGETADSRPQGPPEYSDSDSRRADFDTDAPSYSIAAGQGQGRLTPNPETDHDTLPEGDFPPEYQDVVRERFWAL